MTRDSVYLDELMPLDASELRHVRKLLSGEKRQLLDLQLSKKKLSDDEIRTQLGGISKGQLATLRAKLQAFIATAVGEYRHRDLPENRVRALLQTADAYLNSPLPAHGQRTLGKAIKLALGYGVFNDMDMMQALRRRLPFFLVGNKTAAMRWPEIDRDLVQLAADQTQLLSTIELLNQAHSIKDGGLAGLRTKIEALWMQVPLLDLAVHSKTNLLLCRTHWICDFLLGRVAECESKLDWAMAMSVKEPWLWSDLECFEAIEAAYFTKANMVSRDGKDAAGLALLETFRLRCEEVKRFSLPELREMKRLLTVRLLFQSGNPKEVKRGLKAMLKEIGQPESVHDHLYSLYLCVIEYLISTREFELALPWLALLNDAKLSGRMTSKVTIGFVIELAYWFAAGELDEMDKCTRRFLYFADERMADKVFSGIVVAGFKSLAKNSLNPKQAVHSFLETLETQATSEEFRRYFEIFDLIAFVKGLLASRR